MKLLLVFAGFGASALLAAEKAFSASEMGIERLDPTFDALVPADAKVEKLAEGFLWIEGPTWFQGSVIFSDVPDNVIYQWKPGETAATVFMKPSGLLNPAPGFREPGSNGLAVDAEGRLLICQQGERRVARLEKNGTQTVLAAEFEDRRLNSPNDLAIRDNGDLYFTDPPYGLANFNDSPLKELPHHGVYRVDPKGEVTLLISDLTWPNGIAFSPDKEDPLRRRRPDQLCQPAQGFFPAQRAFLSVLLLKFSDPFSHAASIQPIIAVGRSDKIPLLQKTCCRKPGKLVYPQLSLSQPPFRYDKIFESRPSSFVDPY